MIIIDGEYVLCGTCMYYDRKECCIKGLNGASVSLYKDGVFIDKVLTNKCGNYVFKVMNLGTYLISVNRCEKCKIVCVVLCADPKNVYIKDIIFKDCK